MLGMYSSRSFIIRGLLTIHVSDNIESNIDSIAVDTAGAAEELTTAHEYQRKAGRRALCLMLILVVVVAVVLLAVRIILKIARCSTGIPIIC